MLLVLIVLIVSFIYLFFDSIKTEKLNLIIAIIYLFGAHYSIYGDPSGSLGFAFGHLYCIGFHLTVLLVLFIFKDFEYKFLRSILLVLILGSISFSLPFLFPGFY
jgi:hypothetical protein